MAKKIAVMLDGGHVRVYAKKAGYTYDPSYIEKIAHACVMADEELYRILYYDALLLWERHCFRYRDKRKLSRVQIVGFTS